MNKSLAEQLATITGRQVPEKINDQQRLKGKRSDTYASNGCGASQHLDRLHECLLRISKGDIELMDVIPSFAYTAGLYNLAAHPKKGEITSISEIITRLFDDQSASRIGVREKLLSGAVLAYTIEQKGQLRKALIEYSLDGSFDPSAKYGDSTPRETAFIIRQANRTAFMRELEECKREREERIKQDEIADRINTDELRAVNLRTKNELRNKILNIKKALQSLYDDLTFCRLPTNYEVSHFSPVNLHLILCWANISARDGVGPPQSASDLIKILGFNEANRFWSARIAELAAHTYYKALDMNVSDVSLTQISGSITDWKTHDLVADGIPLDVKNARKSFSSPETYSEHCIPRFKMDFRSKMDVRIVGVLSEYLVESRMTREDTGRCTILGEVGKSDISALQGWLERSFGHLLQVRLTDGTVFIPGWMFEHPVDHQPRRGAVFGKSMPLLADIIDAKLSTPIPKWLIALVSNKESVELCRLSPLDFQIWQQIQSLKNDLGFSRRALFVLILGFTLEMAKSARVEYHPRMWKSWLFADIQINPNTAFHPLGLIDTQKYIMNLIQVLGVMWDRASDKLALFCRFQLAGPNILKGEGVDGEWHTILAYCGGWRSVPVRVKCGKNPIYMGQSESCPSCHRLICPECGYCGRCPLNDKRQADVASVGMRLSNNAVMNL